MSNYITNSSLKESEFNTDLQISDDANEAMFHAVISNDIKSIKSLKKKGLNIDIVDKQGRSLLHIAAEYGHLELFKYFIGKGLNIKYKDIKKNNTFYYACIGCNEEIINIILDIEPAIGRKISNEIGPYINSLLQILYTNRSMETIYKLIASGININETDILNSACKNNDFEFVKYLVSNGADIKQIDQTNLQNERIIDYVYRRGYRINTFDMFAAALDRKNYYIINYMSYNNNNDPNIDKIADLCRCSGILDDLDKMSYLVNILGSYYTKLLFTKIDVSKDIRDKINIQNMEKICEKSNYISDVSSKIIRSDKTANLNVFEQLARNAWQRGESHHP